MGILNQALCTFLICYLCFSMGIIFTWPSCTYANFASVNSTLHRQMTATELSLFSSLSSMGALVSTPVTGILLLDKIGRKYSVMAAALVQVIAWTLIASFKQVEVVLFAIFLSGLGGAAFLVVPMYICEICQENIRGAMTSFSMIVYAVGMLTSYLMGLLPYNVMVYICLTLSVIGVVLLAALKESPTFLMKKGLEKEAAQALAFYRGAKVDSKLVQHEMDTLRRAFNPHLDDVELKAPEEQKLNGGTQHETLTFWQFIKKSRSTRRAALVTLIVITTANFQGLVVIQVFALPLFEEAVPNMSATLCSVVLAVLTILTGLTAAYLSEKAGRKPLLIYASIGTCVCCIVLGTQLQYHWAPHWYTAVLIYMYCSFNTLGAGTVPYVLVAEVFMPEVKSIMSMLVIEWAWLCNFIILFIFGPIVNAIGLAPVFYIFAVICITTVIYSAIYLPETKGLPIDAVQLLFVKK